MVTEEMATEQKSMSFGDHIEELRRRILLGLAGVVVACFVTFPFGKDIIAWLCEPLHHVQRMLGLPAETIALDVTTAFSMWLKVSIMSALLLAGPWVLYQFWKFVSSGLYSTERRVVYLLAPFSTAMIVLGVGFMYYVMLPLCLYFLMMFSTTYPEAGGEKPSFMDQVSRLGAILGGVESEESTEQAIGDELAMGPAVVSVDSIDSLGVTKLDSLSEEPNEPVEGQLWFNSTLNEVRIYAHGKILKLQTSTTASMRNQIEIGKYIGFVTMITLGVVVGFQVPVVMTVAGWTQLVDPKWLAKYRRYCILVCFIMGALLTPADPISMIVLALPLWGLYELGLLLMGRVYGRKGSQESKGESPES